MKVWAQDPWDFVSKRAQQLWVTVSSDSGMLSLGEGRPVCQNIKPENKK